MKREEKILTLNFNMKQYRNLKLLFIFLSAALFLSSSIILLTTSAQTKSPYQIGERLTYNISFEKFENAAYAEIYTVSKGKLDGKDAVELSAKIKSDGLVSAAFYLIDEARSTFISEQTGLPLYIRNLSKTSGLPKEHISNFLTSPTTNYDLLSLIYKVRISGGAGSFSVQENEKTYNFDFAATGGEVVKTDAGEFETTISTVQSTYLTELGITNFRINFTNDESKTPVLIRLKTEKGSFNAKIASIQNLKPEVETTTSPIVTPTVIKTITPTPTPTPQPYIDNEKLSEELPFVLGETLEYRVTKDNQFAGKVVLQVAERKEFDQEDSLKLVVGMSELGQNNQIFNIQDSIEAQVDPNTLAPRQTQINIKGSFNLFNQIANFNQELGIINTNSGNQINVPVGTHSPLSLAYAIRSFNLKPSLDPENPVNDTRVALFLGSQAYVLTLRPSDPSIITIEGKKVSAQMITIRTDDKAFEQLNVRLWLSNDKQRLPLRFNIGSYQADLISTKFIPPK